MDKLLILKSNNKGYVLITVIWLIALMSIMAFGVIWSSNEYKISGSCKS